MHSSQVKNWRVKGEGEGEGVVLMTVGELGLVGGIIEGIGTVWGVGVAYLLLHLLHRNNLASLAIDSLED